MKGIQVLWSPRAAHDAAQGSLWLPLALLGATATFADYPLLLRITSAGVAQAKLSNSPEGLTSFSILVFLALQWAAPVLLPLGAVLTGRLLAFYVTFFLDNKVAAAPVVRIAAWGMLPLGLERVLTGAVTLACGANCDRFNPVATNVAFLLDPKQTEVFWYDAARGLGILAVWAVWSLSAALGHFAEEKTSRIWPAVAVLWAVLLVMRSWLLD